MTVDVVRRAEPAHRAVSVTYRSPAVPRAIAAVISVGKNPGAMALLSVIVNGEPIVEYGEATNRRPGRVLRSDTDTEAPSLAS